MWGHFILSKKMPVAKSVGLVPEFPRYKQRDFNLTSNVSSNAHLGYV